MIEYVRLRLHAVGFGARFFGVLGGFDRFDDLLRVVHVGDVAGNGERHIAAGRHRIEDDVAGEFSDVAIAARLHGKCAAVFSVRIDEDGGLRRADRRHPGR